jgi:hypothetical protein
MKAGGPECERCAKTGLAFTAMTPGVGGCWRVCSDCARFLKAYVTAQQSGTLEMFLVTAKRQRKE